MKLIAGSLALIVGINLICTNAASAKFAQEQIRQVPISRLLKNLEGQRADASGATDRAMVDFRLGRLHAMAYARGVEVGPCKAAALPGSRFELPEFGHTPDHIQFQVEKKYLTPQAKSHLKKAIEHMQAAIKMDPELLTAKLGLAWCFEQSGDKAKAIALYKEVFSSAFDYEKHSKGGMYNWSITLETAEYLQKLLDPVKDKKELEQMKTKVAEIEKLPRYVTPIMIPLYSSCTLNDLVVERNVQFDLDGFGARKYSKWLSPKAAWLVFDAESSGRIDSGIQLVGQSSFWVFWRDGFEVMRGLDDDKDGKLTGEELSGMALWHDSNCNGISERGEVRPLADFGIKELINTSQRHDSGILWNSQGVVYKDGSTAPSFDLVLPGERIGD